MLSFHIVEAKTRLVVLMKEMVEQSVLVACEEFVINNIFVWMQIEFGKGSK